MSRDEEVKNPRLFDNRTIERNIRKGLITRKDYDKHLKSLPDVTDKIAPPEAPRSYVASDRAAAAPDRDRLDMGDLDDQPRLPPGAAVPAAMAASEDEDEDEAALAAGEGEDEDEDEDDDDMSDDTDDLEDEDEPGGEPGAGGEEPPRN